MDFNEDGVIQKITGTDQRSVGQAPRTPRRPTVTAYHVDMNFDTEG